MIFFTNNILVFLHTLIIGTILSGKWTKVRQINDFLQKRFILGICNADCNIPLVLRGSWFSWENGQNTLTEINANTMTHKGYCVEIEEERHSNFTIVFKRDDCYTCVKLLVRTVNVLEKMQCKY